MDSEFPGLIDLNVCGTHYRTLLSTLTKDSDSKLAAMFTGQHPVYKDKDGHYFIEADGFTFQAILHFLRYDELPFQDDNLVNQRRPNTGFGFGAARGVAMFGAGRSTGYSPSDIEMLYKDALNLGINTLVRHLEQFQPNFMNMRMGEYRKSIRGYDNCLDQILRIIPAETLFHKTEFTLRIKQDLQTTYEEKCCEHDCKMLPWNSFNQPFYASIDDVVKVPFDVNPTVLSALTIDLQRRGYIVQGRMTICEFDCKKEVKQSRYVVFAGQVKNCCGAELYLLTFKWDIDADVVTHQNLFGVKTLQQPNAQKQSLFGQQQVGNGAGFTFGSKQVESGQFGSKHAGPVQFGSQQAGSGLFGSQQVTGMFGGSQHGCFGQNQPTGLVVQEQGSFAESGYSGFGSGPQQQQPAFGQQPTQQNAFSFNQTRAPQPGPSSFGSSAVPQHNFFGPINGQKQGSGIMFASSVTNNQQASSSQSQSKLLFSGGHGSLQNQTVAFGRLPVPHVGQKGIVFGSSIGSSGGGFSFGLSQQQKHQQQQKQETRPIFGKGVVFVNQKQKEELFGSSSKSENVFGASSSFEENRLATQSSQPQISKTETGPSTTTETSSDTKPDFSSFLVFGKPTAAAGVIIPDDNSMQHTTDSVSTILTTSTEDAK